MISTLICLNYSAIKASSTQTDKLANKLQAHVRPALLLRPFILAQEQCNLLDEGTLNHGPYSAHPGLSSSIDLTVPQIVRWKGKRGVTKSHDIQTIRLKRGSNSGKKQTRGGRRVTLIHIVKLIRASLGRCPFPGESTLGPRMNRTFVPHDIL